MRQHLQQCLRRMHLTPYTRRVSLDGAGTELEAYFVTMSFMLMQEMPGRTIAYQVNVRPLPLSKKAQALTSLPPCLMHHVIGQVLQAKAPLLDKLL